MTEAVAQILAEIDRLSPPDLAEFADNIVEKLVEKTPAEVERAQIEEVRRRIAEVESGTVRLIPGEQGLAEVRGFVVLAGVRLTRVNRLCGRDQES